MQLIKMRQVKKSFGQVQVLNGIDLEVQVGEVISIIGPSGSGKSTLLRCLIGLEEIDEGIMEINGVSMSRDKALRQKMGMVFQSFNLFPHKTVLENIIEAPLVVKKIPRSQAVKKAELLLEKVGLMAKQDNYPAQLSGGEKQRVAIARALAMEPEIMLFDEPTSALDPELVGEVLAVIRDLAREKITMLVVTHEMGFAREVSDRIIFMEQGKIVADAVPSKFFSLPEHERIENFLAKIL